MNSTKLKLPPLFVSSLRRPGKPDIPLRLEGNTFVAGAGGPDEVFPVIGGTPVLINEPNSVFRIRDFNAQTVTTLDLREEHVRLDTPVKRFKSFLGKLTPSKSRSVSAFDERQALSYVLDENPDAKVLIVGAGEVRFGSGVDANIVYSDVALAPDTHLIADCHDLPFAKETFDAVIAVAVLEHVADPYRCVAEIQRVLKSHGYVYAVTPFMQQVHMGRYDFTRFTSMGHRRLFRWFDQVEAGVANGPGMAVGWSIEYFLSSFSEGAKSRRLLRTASRFIAWPFLLFDKGLARKRGAYDCASAFYFFGRLRPAPVTDREIVESYRGLN